MRLYNAELKNFSLIEPLVIAVKEEKKLNKEESLKIVDLIINDLSNRRGIGDVWQGLDDGIQDEIKEEWCNIIIEHATEYDAL